MIRSDASGITSHILPCSDAAIVLSFTAERHTLCPLLEVTTNSLAEDLHTVFSPGGG